MFEKFTDRHRRLVVANNEPLRLALKWLATARNIVPDRVRFLAQFRLAALSPATAETRLSRRCIVTGRGRGVIPDFNVSRIVFRKMALEGKLPGVTKASW